MFKQLIELVQQLLFLLRDVQQNKEDIAKLRRESEETNEALRQLAFELRSMREEERHEREKFMLKIENALLKFERQLPRRRDSRKLR